jgi:hypothetical protein
MKNYEIEEFYHINARKLASLRKANIDVMNPYAVKAKILGQNRRPHKWVNGCPFTDAEADAFLMEHGNSVLSKNDKTKPSGQNDHLISSDTAESLLDRANRAEDYDDARFCYTKARALKEARQLHILEGEYMSKENVQADFARLGYALRAGITAMSHDLAPALAGLDEVAVSKKVKIAGVNILKMLGDDASKLYDGAPPASEV